MPSAISATVREPLLRVMNTTKSKPFRPLQSTSWCLLAALALAGCGAKSPTLTTGKSTKVEPSRLVAVDTKSAATTRGNSDGVSQEVSPKNESTPADASAKNGGPQHHTTFFRGDNAPAKIPKVLLTSKDKALCEVKVGDTMPRYHASETRWRQVETGGPVRQEGDGRCVLEE